MTSQAPHAIRTVFALVTGLPEQNIRIISPDLGGGFGNKVPVYPGYVVATAASLLIGRPVKWIEDRTENLISTGFARDFHMTGDLALDKDGKMLALRVHLDSDNGAFFSDAQPSKFKAGLFHIVTGSYDIPTAHVTADGYYTNKAPGGVAYRCSFRVTEASYLIERLVTNAALEIGMDQAEFRMKNFIQPEQFPYTSATGWVYDSGDYPKAMNVALEKLGYDALKKDVEARRKKGDVTGIGIASFTEVVGAGHGAEFDILGLRMFDSAELRVHPTGKAMLRMGVKSQGQGHETTFAQIVAEELSSRPPTSPSRKATPTPPPTVWAPTRRGARRSPAQLRRWCRGGCATRRGRSPPTCWRRPKRTSCGSGASSASRVRRTSPRRSRRSRSPLTPTSRRGWRPASRAFTTTTRRT
jgi:carbon-monoxide dehydrogenase large subunit